MGKTADTEVDRRLRLFAGELYSANRIGAWYFDDKKQLLYSTYEHWEAFQGFLETGGMLDAALSVAQEDTHPEVLTDLMDMVWITEPVHYARGVTLYLLVGPVFIKTLSRELILKKLSAMSLSVAMRAKFTRILGDVPVIDQSGIGWIYRMMHYTIYDEFLPRSAMTFRNLPRDDGEESGQDRDADETDPDGVKVPLSNNYGLMAEMEKNLTDCVRRGEFHEGESKGGSGYAGELQAFPLEDDLRITKDNAIIFMDHCCTAAIEGGLSVQTAKRMQEEGVAKVEKCATLGELANVHWGIFLSYVEAVRKGKEAASNGISEPVRRTMDYIHANYMRSITLQDMAKNVNYTEYYLSRKFTKETGYKIQDYVKSVRIDMAKVMLITSQRSISEIAEQLQFRSRSHFDHIFHDLVGTTPARYRTEAGSAERARAEPEEDGTGEE